MKNKMDLRGEWSFCLDGEKRGLEERYWERAYTDTICLPSTTAYARKGSRSEARETGYLTEPYHFEGYAWYSRELELSGEQLASIATLRLERTRISYVYIDGQYVGRQDSFACAHTYDLTAYLTKSRHRLTVMVSNVDYATPGGHMTSPDTQTNWNGILGEISLTFEPQLVISGLQVYASAENREVRVSYRTTCNKKGLNGRADGEEAFPVCAELVCRAVHTEQESAGDGELLFRKRMELDAAAEGIKEITIAIGQEQELLLWNEYTPQLYRLCVSVGESRAETMFGFRDLHTRGRQFYLNDLEIMLRGKHDGMIFPLTGFAPMEKEQWKEVFATAKQYGINHYRFHTCCPPEAAFAAADEMGMYLAPELPFWGTVAGEQETDEEKRGRSYLLEEGFRILEQFGNHPSFVIFSLGNELWGSKQVLNEILGSYKAKDDRHWYVQGSNNFQWFPEILEQDDFFCGVRFTKERRFRGSYAMCDAPQGHVQTDEPESCYTYDDAICPQQQTGNADAAGEVEIQYQTGVRRVKVEQGEEVIPQIPVVSHEIGQYEIYPDFGEISKYQGVLQPENLKIFRERLAEQGMLHMADAFFHASGQLAVACYKRELETAFRSRELSGFQLLDLQDFTGQGTALVGILNAFMENKGLITAEKWREFCNDRVLLLSFPTYIYRAGEQFAYEIQLCNMRPEQEQPVTVTVQICDRAAGKCVAEQSHDGMLELTRWKSFGSGTLTLPQSTQPQILTVSVSMTGAQMTERVSNHYDIYVYPETAGMQNPENVVVTGDAQEMLDALAEGRGVLFFGESLQEESSVPGTYCTDFWCYPMFSSISESMGKPLPVGTMGLCMEKEHPALAQFPNDGCTSPQWWKLIEGTKLVVMDGLEADPMIWMIDNFGRNHKLGMVYEAKVGKGKLLVCQRDLRQMESPEAQWFYRSLLSYVSSEAFSPQQEIEAAWLTQRYGA